MKKKIVIALIATLTLTLGSFGTVFAMNSNPVIELQTNETLKQGDQPEHVHTWGEDQCTVMTVPWMLKYFWWHHHSIFPGKKHEKKVAPETEVFDTK